MLLRSSPTITHHYHPTATSRDETTDTISSHEALLVSANLAKIDEEESDSDTIDEATSDTRRDSAPSPAKSTTTTTKSVHIVSSSSSSCALLGSSSSSTLTPAPPPPPPPTSSKKMNIAWSRAQRKRSSAGSSSNGGAPFANDLDHILDLIGSFGLYQKIQFLLVGFLAIVPSMVAYSYVFVSATPNFTCTMLREIRLTSVNSSSVSYASPIDAAGIKLTDNVMDNANSDDPFRHLKLEKAEYLIETRRFVRLWPLDSPHIVYDNNCDVNKLVDRLDNNNNNGRQVTTTTTSNGVGKRTSKATATASSNYKSNYQCYEWSYDTSVYGRTTVTDWNLVCLKSHMKASTQNAFILGTGCSLFTGILSDKYGRRFALLTMITLMVLVLNVTQFLMHTPLLSAEAKFAVFTCSRFLQGVAQTMYSIGFVLLLEMTGPKHRVTAGNILAYSFSIGQIALVALSYVLRNWLKIQWALALYVIPYVTFTSLFFCTISNSKLAPN